MKRLKSEDPKNSVTGFSVPESMLRMLDEIMQLEGFQSRSEAIRQCIREYYFLQHPKDEKDIK